MLDVVEFVALAKALGADPLSLFADYLVALQRAKLPEGGWGREARGQVSGFDN